MRDDVLYLLGSKTRQNGDCHCSIGHDSHKGYTPSGTAITTQGDVVATLNATFTEMSMVVVDEVSYFTIRKVVTAIIGEGFLRPVILDGLLK